MICDTPSVLNELAIIIGTFKVLAAVRQTKRNFKSRVFFAYYMILSIACMVYGDPLVGITLLIAQQVNHC